VYGIHQRQHVVDRADSATTSRQTADGGVRAFRCSERDQRLVGSPPSARRTPRSTVAGQANGSFAYTEPTASALTLARCRPLDHVDERRTSPFRRPKRITLV